MEERPDPTHAGPARRCDRSYRVNVSETGIHVYNRGGMTTATDPYDLYPKAGKQRRGVL